MEKELQNLRKAMDSSTHKGIHFTAIQKERIKAALPNDEVVTMEKPNFYYYIVTVLAASLFILFFYTDIVANLSTSNKVEQGSQQALENEWKVRNEYSKNGKKLFVVFPDPYLTAGKPYGYIFSFKEPFEVYEGKELEIYATKKESGKRMNLLPPTKITEPTSGYSTLGRFTAQLSLPESGIWKYEVFLDKKLYGDVVLAVGEKRFIPIDAPSFVNEGDFEKIDWNRKAVDLGHNIIGNKNKSGVIGANMPSIKRNQKWMWHLWGIEKPSGTDLTVVGFHRETETVHQILTYPSWTIELGGENNGADAHTPSSVNIPMAGEWAILLYVDGKLYDILVYNIKH
ncbi:hypothetical protein AM500_03140 [Bacillus sp. FJAT-18017]|uniref:hypothetical protein n=1 Tax=Bacillus sp. FJAT-18017 TaxID=1705566 RepID=UPI0006B03AD7|nr:hypothetical protein [Bacillus sp. FJAT-18017]ALC88905.1 hypothetical protein AM500_03140 [Bacillus sp. FJAT-18017]